MIHFLIEHPLIMPVFLFIVWLFAVTQTLITGYKTFKSKGQNVTFRLEKGKPAKVCFPIDTAGKIKINSNKKFTVTFKKETFESSEFSAFIHLGEFAIDGLGKLELIEGDYVHVEIAANSGEVEISIPKSSGDKFSAATIVFTITILMGIAIGLSLDF